MIGTVAVSIVEKASGRNMAHILSIILSLLFPTYNLSLCFSKAYTNEHTFESCRIIDCTIKEMYEFAKDCCGNIDGSFFFSFFRFK